MAANPESEIRQKLAELPRRNMKCDLVFQIGDYSFLARKDVLMLRMEYFRGMFTANMQEKDQTFIELDPEIVDPEVFDELLDYVYTLNITFTNENLESIYRAADFFCFDELKAKTESFMRSNINKDNVSLLLDIAMKFELKAQEEECKQFIISNPLLASKTRPEVGYLSFIELSSLLQKLCEQAKFEDMFHSAIEWILYDKRNRSQRVSELLQMIPPRQLSSDFFTQVISKNTIVMNDMKCLQSLFKSIIVDYNPPVEELYVFGGKDGANTTLSSMSTYDSSTRQWSELKPMPQGITHFAYCVVNQKIYVCGGHNGQKNMNNLFMFDTITHQWNTLKAMKYPRQSCAMAVLDGHLYVAGGYHYPNERLSVVERYSIQDDEWTTVSSMIHKREGLELVQMTGLLYAIGGQYETVHKSVEQFNPRTGKWTALAEMNYYYVHFGSAVLNNRIYVVGQDFCEKYNPEEDKWKVMASATKCGYGRRLALFNGKLHAIGGSIGEVRDFKGIKTVECYDFEKRSWITAKATNIARCDHGVAVVTRKCTPE